MVYIKITCLNIIYNKFENNLIDNNNLKKKKDTVSNLFKC